MIRIFRLFKYLTKLDAVCLIISFFTIAGQVHFDLRLPDYMTEITEFVETPGSTMNDVLLAGAKMLTCAFASITLSIVATVLIARVATNFTANLRKCLYDSVQSFSMEEIGNFSTASLITRSTNDITQIQNFIIFGTLVLVRAPLMVFFGITKIANKNMNWTFAVSFVILATILIVITCVAITVPKFMKVQGYTDDLNRVAGENLSGRYVVRAYNAEKYQEDKFAVTNDNLTGVNIFVNTSLSLLMPIIQLGINAVTLVVYWLGAYMINAAGNPQDRLTLFSEMIVFSSYAINILISFMMLVIVFTILPRASVSAGRVLEVLNTEVKIKDGTVEKNDNGQVGEIEFKNVSFKYPDYHENVISDINFKAHKGDTVALIGSTGCGKTTVINLIPRFYDVSEGEVLVDGINVKDYTQKALRNKIGYVSQQAILFSGTITSNVAYGDNERDENKKDFVTTDENISVGNAENAKGSDAIPPAEKSGKETEKFDDAENSTEHNDIADAENSVDAKTVFEDMRESDANIFEEGIDPEGVKSAISVAQADEFVSKKEAGIESAVAQNGSNFSGGQKQRLSIARAVYKNPEILIFDDSFSALDYKTDKVLRKALNEKCKDATKVIVAQRIGTIRDADLILVLRRGKIVGQGKHDELMKTCETYQEIAYSQLSKEELA